ncbi:endonuclease/exonuclease/phosphatase family protein [Chryseobacterium sp. OV279]|uniref:endonuclease/exonuclease/phosphatase family protein n=1 Tax=Chryseobacterium sp. OV279 TaxID=1500285 RepID=UPI0006481069|nr:endonuclease/exonuclease/phosphatase family protein [Chryseobacterium sp. OV279]SHG37681.1 Endonuclease/Exonuclease/phosphatase family protein [Chryseobacterium sp. OV279]
MKRFMSFMAIVFSVMAFAQQGKLRKVAAVGFLNVENLWDTIRSADYIDGTKDIHNPAFHRSIPLDSIKFLEAEKHDGPWSDSALKGKKAVRYQSGSEEFTPSSGKNYNTKIYKAKLANEAKVIAELGAQYTKTAPAVVGLIEVENRQVIEDLVKQPALAKYDYGIVHYNSYDYRGIDVALIYQKRRFTVTNSLKKELKVFGDDGKREYTRDILVVTGFLDNEKVAFFMNHWPSRRGGEAVSLPKRNAAAALLKQQMDSIRTADPTTKLFAMGDFNDDPVSSSLKNYLKAAASPKDLSETTPYLNLMYPLYKKGIASLAYQDAPNLFDQIIVSKNLVSDQVTKEYSVYKAEIFAPPYLVNKEGNYKGYPFRSWNGDQFTGGYSDHFPAFVILQKEP